MNREDAEELTQAVSQSVSGAWRTIARLQKLGVPKALGLSAQDWVKQRLGGYVQMAVEERYEAARELKADGRSTRQIGAALGVDHETVRKDLLRRGEKSPVDGRKQKGPRVNMTARGEKSPAPLDTLAALSATTAVQTAAAATDTRDSKRVAYKAKLEDEATKTAKAIAGVYDVLVVDPPWPMEKIERDVRPNQSEFGYTAMTEAELAALPMPTGTDAHVWVWTTHRFLPMAFRLLEAWDLKYVCTFVWHKPGGFQPIGLPQYNCEFALYARKGAPQFVDAKASNVCFRAPRGAHSEKPDEFYDFVRRVTAGRRLDMFSRRAIEGFDGWGKEAVS